MSWAEKCIVAIDPTSTDQELVGVVRLLSDSMDEMEARGQEYEPPTLVVNGFNDDPRELWHIPKAIELIKRAFAAGFVAVLEPSVLFGPRANRGAFGLGAFEVWLFAKGLIDVDRGMCEIDSGVMLDFVAEVMTAEVQRVGRMIESMRMGGGE